MRAIILDHGNSGCVVKSVFDSWREKFFEFDIVNF